MPNYWIKNREVLAQMISFWRKTCKVLVKIRSSCRKILKVYAKMMYYWYKNSKLKGKMTTSDLKHLRDRKVKDRKVRAKITSFLRKSRKVYFSENEC